MNKDNKKLTELYHLIQEGFEPAGWEDQNKDYSKEELLELILHTITPQEPSEEHKEVYDMVIADHTPIIADLIDQGTTVYYFNHCIHGEPLSSRHAWNIIRDLPLMTYAAMPNYDSIAATLKKNLEKMEKPKFLYKYLTNN